MIGFFLLCAAFADSRVPYDIQELATRADACSSVWGQTRSFSTTKFTSLDIEEKNEAILSSNRCSTLARNVINTCLKYQQDVNLKKICTHLLVQTASDGQAAPAINSHGPNAPAAVPVVIMPTKQNPPPTMNSMPGSGYPPANASGAAMTGPTPPAAVVATPSGEPVPQTEPAVAPTIQIDTTSPAVSRETASPPAAH